MVRFGCCFFKGKSYRAVRFGKNRENSTALYPHRSKVLGFETPEAQLGELCANSRICRARGERQVPTFSPRMNSKSPALLGVLIIMHGHGRV